MAVTGSKAEDIGSWHESAWRRRARLRPKRGGCLGRHGATLAPAWPSSRTTKAPVSMGQRHRPPPRTRPVAQQQQQVQPKEDDKNDKVLSGVGSSALAAAFLDDARPATYPRDAVRHLDLGGGRFRRRWRRPGPRSFFPSGSSLSVGAVLDAGACAAAFALPRITGSPSLPLPMITTFELVDCESEASPRCRARSGRNRDALRDDRLELVDALGLDLLAFQPARARRGTCIPRICNTARSCD